MRLSRGIQLIGSVAILVQHKICVVVLGMSIIIHKQEAYASHFDDSLVVSTEVISINDDPAHIELLCQIYGMNSIIGASRLDRQINNFEPF